MEDLHCFSSYDFVVFESGCTKNLEACGVMWQVIALNLLPLLINDGNSERQLSQPGCVNLTPSALTTKSMTGI